MSEFVAKQIGLVITTFMAKEVNVPQKPDSALFCCTKSPLVSVHLFVVTFVFLNTSNMKYLLHFELEYFTGVKTLTPPKKYISHYKNEVKAITHLVTKKFV